MRARAVYGLVIAVSVAGAAHAQAPHVIPPRAPAIADAKPDAQGVKHMAVFRGLDKITGRARDIDAPVGVPVKFGTLTLTVQYCHTVPPEEPPETTAFVQIDENVPGAKPKRMFSGWMFASSPALNGLEHPTYDVWVVTCKTDEPTAAAATAKSPSVAGTPSAPASRPGVAASAAPRPTPPAAVRPPAPARPPEPENVPPDNPVAPDNTPPLDNAPAPNNPSLPDNP